LAEGGGRVETPVVARCFQPGAGLLLGGLQECDRKNLAPQWLASLRLLPGCYFLLSIAHQGGALSSFVGLSTLILLLSLMGGGGMVMARRLPDVE